EMPVDDFVHLHDVDSLEVFCILVLASAFPDTADCAEVKPSVLSNVLAYPYLSPSEVQGTSYPLRHPHRRLQPEPRHANKPLAEEAEKLVQCGARIVGVDLVVGPLDGRKNIVGGLDKQIARVA